MSTADELDHLQSYLNGRRDGLDSVISTARGPGSRALKVRLIAMRDEIEQQLLLATRNVVAARAREAEAADEAMNCRDSAGQSLRMSFSKPGT